LKIITGLWSTPVGDAFTFEGRYYQLRDSPALPKPYANRPPIIIGGGGTKRTPRLAVRYADEYNINFKPVGDTRTGIDRVKEMGAERGRASDLRYSAAQELCCGRDDAEVARRAATAMRRDLVELREKGLVGSPSEIVDKIGQFRDIGCSRLY